MSAISGDWLEALKGEFHQPYYAKLYKTVMTEYQTRKIFPPADDLFNAFHFTPLNEVKVVILGQDPYHNDGQAHGLCFSVKRGVETPPSLVNIYQELHDDCGCYIPNNGYLEKWAKQGVLLLNTVLTVRAHQANSHRGIGWEQFTDAAIQVLNEQDRPMVFLLWGRPAQMKKSMLNNPKHLILEAPHPSPLSAYRGFFGCKHFSKAKGGKPKDKNIRGLAWVACRWAGLVRPRVIMLENVEEFKTWGPLNRGHHPIKSKQGKTFKKFVEDLKNLGMQRVEINQRTFKKSKHNEPIDHIFIPNSWIIKDKKIIDQKYLDNYSDHYPIIITVIPSN